MFIMKTVILYRPNSEMARPVEMFVRDLKARYAHIKVEMVHVDDRDGIALASLYDIMDFPALMVLALDGTLLHLWQGKQLPLIDEVAAYALGNQ